jgi:hypothetical protein
VRCGGLSAERRGRNHLAEQPKPLRAEHVDRVRGSPSSLSRKLLQRVDTVRGHKAPAHAPTCELAVAAAPALAAAGEAAEPAPALAPTGNAAEPAPLIAATGDVAVVAAPAFATAGEAAEAPPPLRGHKARPVKRTRPPRSTRSWSLVTSTSAYGSQKNCTHCYRRSNVQFKLGPLVAQTTAVNKKLRERAIQRGLATASRSARV